MKSDMTTTDILMVVFTAVIAVTAVLGAIIFNRQLTAMQGQVDAMLADQRPWLKVSVKIRAPFSIVVDAKAPSKLVFGSLPLDVSISNVGRSPAFNVQYGVWGFLEKPGRDVMAQMKISCERMRTQPLDNPSRGAIIFPNDSINPDDFGFGGSLVAGFSSDDLKEALSKDAQGEHFGFWIYGCVDYVFGQPQQHHQTGFLYRVGKIIDRPGLPQGLTFQLDPLESSPADHLRLFPNPSSTVQTD